LALNDGRATAVDILKECFINVKITIFRRIGTGKPTNKKWTLSGNNIANVNTYGYKSSRVTFQDVYYQTLRSASGGTTVSGGINASQIGYGVQLGSIDTMMSRSGFQMTSSGLDMAIAGEGFFQVQDQSGNIMYTRGWNP